MQKSLHFFFEPDVLTATDYYPFGMEMPGRKYNPQGYRYGFNGKENDRSGEWGLGLVQDYGFRLYNPGLSRFFSVDPLTEKYPELTTYQFASNTPIQAIDLDGLEAFFVHGTFSNNSRWKNGKNLNEAGNYLFKASSNKTWNTSFNWGLGPEKFPFRPGNLLWNDVEDRAKAAQELANHVFSNRNKENSEDITLITHSHGGNVAIQAIPIIRKMLDDAGFKDTKISLITLATPAVNKKNDVENPEKLFNRSLNTHMHLYNNYDGVQVDGAQTMDRQTFDRTYDNGYTYNYLVDLSKYYKTGGFWNQAAHSFDVLHPETLKNPIEVELIKIPEAERTSTIPVKKTK